MRSEDYQPPIAGLLENYLSDSSVGADEDSDQEVRGDVTSRSTVSAAKSAPYKGDHRQGGEVEGRRSEGRGSKDREARGREEEGKGADPTPTTKDVEEKDEAIDLLSGQDNIVAPRSPSLATKWKWELEMKMSEEDLRRIKQAQLAKAGVQAKMPTKVPSQQLKPKARVKAAAR